MILPGVNVLIYAFRADSARHSVCKPWLDKVVLGDAQFGLSPLALSALARIASNSHVFREPSPVEEVFAFCDNLLGQPHCQPVSSVPRHWAIFTRICLETRVRGPRISDAWFAALAIEHGCALDHLRSRLMRGFRDSSGGSRYCNLVSGVCGSDLRLAAEEAQSAPSPDYAARVGGSSLRD